SIGCSGRSSKMGQVRSDGWQETSPFKPPWPNPSRNRDLTATPDLPQQSAHQLTAPRARLRRKEDVPMTRTTLALVSARARGGGMHRSMWTRQIVEAVSIVAVAVAVAAVGSVDATAQAAGPEATVKQFVDDFNKGDIKSAASTQASDV